MHGTEEAELAKLRAQREALRQEERAKREASRDLLSSSRGCDCRKKEREVKTDL